MDNKPMRLLTMILLLATFSTFAQTSDEQAVIATVQKTFDGMAAHDGAMIRSTMLGDAHLYAIREGSAPTSRTIEDFVTQIASAKNELLERFTAPPKVTIRGPMAQVWGEYEFLRDGKFTHCGVDSVSLFKTPEGWKIATIVYTVETTSCKNQ
jgi:hypothetical protein